MTLLGFLHGGGGARTGGHPLTGHSHILGGRAHAVAPAGHHGPAHAGHAAKANAPSQAKGSSVAKSSLLQNLFVISPLDVFSFALGAGAVGVACKHVLVGLPLSIAAIAGALVFNYGVIKPIMSNLLRFSTTPSEGLEGMVAQLATAVTNFDSTGRGLVKVQMDGQISQLLASIDPAELHRGVRVHKGDEVVVIEVDATRNTCRVTRELAD